VLLFALTGCTVTAPDGTAFPRGADEAAVQAKFGMPEVVSESSGDTMRLYTPFDRPEEYWPRDSRTELYYIARNTVFRFDRSGLVSAAELGDSPSLSLLNEIAEYGRKLQAGERP
jgi:hypothetical protein